jgi:hypothetical protein
MSTESTPSADKSVTEIEVAPEDSQFSVSDAIRIVRNGCRGIFIRNGVSIPVSCTSLAQLSLEQRTALTTAVSEKLGKTVRLVEADESAKDTTKKFPSMGGVWRKR